MIDEDGVETFADTWWNEEEERWGMNMTSLYNFTITHWMEIEKPPKRNTADATENSMTTHVPQGKTQKED